VNQPEKELARILKGLAETATLRDDWLYSSPYEALLDRGEFFDPNQPISPQYVDIAEEIVSDPKYCSIQNCFKNAWMQSALNPEVSYVEGAALIAGQVRHHAWNAFPDGSMIDCTWCGGDVTPGAGDAYLGITVPREETRTWIPQDQSSLLVFDSDKDEYGRKLNAWWKDKYLEDGFWWN
jgi:hypothetical protein